MVRKSSTLASGFTWPPLASRQLMCTVSPGAIVSRGLRARFQRECVGSALKRCSVMDTSYLHDHLHLNQRIARQGAYADGGSRVPALVSEDLHQQIGSPVDDCGWIRKP